ncbi:MAG TPA: S8 family serine peptidase [Verrucomicrobiae bacterium]|nr:S8 family serine peptidase [Verrucomicrobiae bacterium]
MKRSTPWIVLFILLELVGQTAVAVDSSTNQFEFRLPHLETFRIDSTARRAANGSNRVDWIRAYRDGSTNVTEFGNRVVVEIDSAADLKTLIANHPLTISRVIRSNIFVLQAPDAITSVQEAARLASEPAVQTAYPVLRRTGILNSPYALRSNDPFFVPYFNVSPSYDALWFLENRLYDGTRNGLDLNVLAAWPITRGEGVTVAVVDTGLETNHPELAPRLIGAPHFNFGNQTTNAGPIDGTEFDPNRSIWTHGTSVGGLIAAESNNGRGMTGVAPFAHLASWLIFNTNLSLADDEALMDMYQHAADTVAVQNHSWGGGNGLVNQIGPTLLEHIGIENAATLGRGGRGTVMVRSAGNDRALRARADDDSYVDDPRVIAVAAVTKSGRATDYSEPGACVLLAAPGGGGDTSQGLFTLDLVGSHRGVNAGITYQGDLNDYRWGVQGFIGTSAAAPLVSGVAALVLSANTNLSARDVQQILILSARHGDLADPDVVTNGAGLRVSHRVGFGIPDAGEAVRLAQLWTNRSPLVEIAFTNDSTIEIPDDGLRVEITGEGTPASLASIHSLPGTGSHADAPTLALPLIDIGSATSIPAANLTNRGALIIRGENTFAEKISNAAAAGASFAVIYNYSTNVDAAGGGDVLTAMGATDYTPIPAVFIGHSDGEVLKALFETNANARARIHLQSAETTFHVSDTLICEHVGVRVQTDHQRRADVRITLISPQGTRSVLQEFNNDPTPGPTDWTYWSTHHFFESSAGDWTVSISDEFSGATGSVHQVSLIMRGTAIEDSDHDGLDDNWELAQFNSLAQGLKDDPDGDGSNNAREQAIGSDAGAKDFPFACDLNWWELAGYRLSRLTWPSVPGAMYEVYGGTNLNALELLATVPGGFPETEWLGPFSAAPESRFFRVRAISNP